MLHVSSRVNEVIRTIFHLFIFLRKILQQKNAKQAKQLTKQKQANTKQQKQQFFRIQKLQKREKLFVLLVAFYLFCDFYVAKYFLKKVNRWTIVLITLFIMLLSKTEGLKELHWVIELSALEKINSICFQRITAWKVSKYGVISGPYFPVFSPNTGKYGPETTPYLDTFHAVNVTCDFKNKA